MPHIFGHGLKYDYTEKRKTPHFSGVKIDCFERRQGF